MYFFGYFMFMFTYYYRSERNTHLMAHHHIIFFSLSKYCNLEYFLLVETPVLSNCNCSEKVAREIDCHRKSFSFRIFVYINDINILLYCV